MMKRKIIIEISRSINMETYGHYIKFKFEPLLILKWNYTEFSEEEEKIIKDIIRENVNAFTLEESGTLIYSDDMFEHAFYIYKELVNKMMIHERALAECGTALKDDIEEKVSNVEVEIKFGYNDPVILEA